MPAISNATIGQKNLVCEAAIADATALTGGVAQVSEVTELCHVAKDLKINFALDGGVARNFLSFWRKDGSTDNTTELVGPLSDIDLIASPSTSTTVVERVKDYLPATKFLHIETCSNDPALQTYPRSGNIRSINPPRIWFIGNADDAPSLKSDCEVSFSLAPGQGDELKLDGDPKSLSETTSLELRTRMSKDNVSEALDALFDLLFLLRVPLVFGTDPTEDEILLKLIARIKRVSSDDLAKTVLGSKQDFRRLGILLLKATCFEARRPSKNPRVHHLGLQAYLTNFFHHIGDTALISMWMHFSNRLGIPFQSVVCPSLENGRWRRSVTTFEFSESRNPLEGSELLEHWNKELQQGSLEGMSASPFFRIQTVDAPDPWCCKYEDFSRGHLEAVWFDPSSPTEGTKLEQYLTPVFSRKREEVAFTHSHQFIGSVSSARLDFGHLCALTSKSETIAVSAVTAEVPS